MASRLGQTALAYGEWVETYRARHMASGLVQTALAIWRVGRDVPRSPYWEWAGTDCTRHMESGSRRTALAIWRAGWDMEGVNSDWDEAKDILIETQRRTTWARHMPTERNELAIWRAGLGRPNSDLLQVVGTVG
ncbi:hypothetical protein Rs2_18395 [Raphanus sativus]|nr:hypothetical protein Rs2_18395 [Raphanus sativus]